MINREIEKQLVKHFFKGKIIMLSGARQVGKTTLMAQDRLVKQL